MGQTFVNDMSAEHPNTEEYWQDEPTVGTFGRGSSKQGDGSGLSVFKSFFTEKERKRLLRFIIKALKNVKPSPDKWVDFTFAFDGDIKEIFEERLKDVRAEGFVNFSEYENLKVRVWFNVAGALTLPHYDAGGVCVLGTQLIGRKRWFTKRPGVDVLWKTLPYGSPHFFTGDRFWKQQRDDIEPGDLVLMPEYTYHTVGYSTDAISIDVTGRRKGFSLTRLDHCWPALKAYWYPRPNKFNLMCHYLLLPFCWLFVLWSPLAAWRRYRLGASKYSEKNMEKNQKRTLSSLPWLEEHMNAIPD